MTGSTLDHTVIATDSLSFEELRGAPLPEGPIQAQADVVVVRSIDQVRQKAFDPSCRTIIWKRDPELWLPVLTALHSFITDNAELKRDEYVWKHEPHLDAFVVPAASTSSQILEELLRLGQFNEFAREHPKAWDILLQDFKDISETVGLMNENRRLISWRFTRVPTPFKNAGESGFELHFHPEDFTALVDYSIEGAGPVIARHASVKEVANSQVGDVVKVICTEKPFHLLPNVVVFMKGGMSSVIPFEVGTVHGSPSDENPAFPYTLRLAHGFYTASEKAKRLYARH